MPRLTRFALPALALATLLTLATDASAQSGFSRSSSYSNSYSSNYGRSYSFGPGGVHSTGFNNSSYRGSRTNSVSGFSPYGGFNRSSTHNTGWDRGRNFSSGYTPGFGGYHNVGGGFRSFNNGRNSFNTWRW